jgi:hypothetical protein
VDEVQVGIAACADRERVQHDVARRIRVRVRAEGPTDRFLQRHRRGSRDCNTLAGQAPRRKTRRQRNGCRGVRRGADGTSAAAQDAASRDRLRPRKTVNALNGATVGAPESASPRCGTRPRPTVPIVRDSATRCANSSERLLAIAPRLMLETRRPGALLAPAPQTKNRGGYQAMRISRRAKRALTLVALGAVLTGMLVVSTKTYAEQAVPAAGDVIDRTNMHLYSDYLSPGLKWIIERGVKMRVRDYGKLQLAKPFLEATEQYAGQVKLSDDETYLINHVAGLPFPIIDDNDPKIAAKLIFNFNAAIAVDDLDLRNFDCDTGTVGKDGDPLHVERHFLIDHIRRLYWIERTEVDPKPVNPVNDDQVRYKEALYPIIEPFDLKGTGFTFNRYIDHERQDDSWLYLPQLRRVRRLSSAQRSDALFGQDTDQDSYAGYAGNPAWMTWKYLGTKTIMGSYHSEHLPVKWGEGSANFMHDDWWEPRKVWIVEGVSKLPQYAYSKRVIMIDQDTYRIPSTDMYDQAGELWKMWVNNYKFAKKAIPEAKYGFDWDVSFNPSISMIDFQLEHATHCSLPSSTFPGEQGWYINVGDQEGTTEEYFALSSIISAGR